MSTRRDALVALTVLSLVQTGIQGPSPVEAGWAAFLARVAITALIGSVYTWVGWCAGRAEERERLDLP